MKMEPRKIAEKVWLDIYNNDTLIYNTFEEYWLSEFNKQNTMEKFARKCSATSEGMNDGYVYLDGDMYFKYEKDLVAHLRGLCEDNNELSDEFLLKESYDLEEYYYTEWNDEDDYEYQMINGILTEI